MAASLKQVSYSIHFFTAHNVKLAIIKDFVTLDYTRSVNAPGSMKLVLPATSGNKALVSTGSEIRRDIRLEIWRLLGGREYLETGTQWISYKVEIDDNSEVITIWAKSGLTLLNRRAIAYNARSDQASKSGAADDVIVEFVDENLGSSATDSDRDWSDLIVIRASPGNGATVNKAASRRNLLTTIQDVARQGTVQGTPQFFDMNYVIGSQKFEFQTYTGQRGSDLTSGQSQLVFGTEYNNLTNQKRTDDFSSEATYVYAAGQGAADERNVVSASDSGRINSSPFGRIEYVADSRNTVDTDALTSEAEANLRQRRPKRTLSGTIINKPGTEYGLNWNWGDKVKVDYDGQVFTARIDTISVSVANGKEDIQADIRIED